MNTAVLFSSARDDWQTPPDLFAELDAEFGFVWDVAAARCSSMCGEFYFGPDHGFTDQRNALALNWADWLVVEEFPGGPCWCNPPYSRGLQAKFIAKAALERLNGVTTVMLIPARTDTKAFHAYVWNAETHSPREGVEVRFLPGRITFVGAKHGAPFPSMVIVFRGAKPQSLLAPEAQP